jgi:4-hydroxythreonine-4-phosphate dehydrogenase
MDKAVRAELQDAEVEDSSPEPIRSDADGMVSVKDLDDAIRSARGKSSLSSLSSRLTGLGYVNYEAKYYTDLAKDRGIAFVALSHLEIPTAVLRQVDAEIAQVFRIIPIAEYEGRLVIATADPLNDAVLDNVQRLLERDIEVRSATPQDISAALEKYYDLQDSTIKAILNRQKVPVYDAGITAPAPRPGQLDPEAGRAAVEWTIAATRLVIDGVVDAIVTCPINKEGIHKAGYHYNGHTELIAELAGAPDYKMSLFAGNMRIVHITTHLSLRDAVNEVKTDRILTTIRVAHAALLRLGLPQRRIAVAGLNPHAGEAGAFGREEIDEIEPAIRAAKAEGIDCSGPYPADTIFRRMQDNEFDLVVAMYHDQGHVPLKLIAMDEGVNVTLGLPIVRTSVDHGTAYEIAGKGVAREASLMSALRLAAEFAQRRPESTK